MDGTLICGALLIAIMLLRQRGQNSDAVANAPVSVDTDDSYHTGALCGSNLFTHESSFLSSGDDWSDSSAIDDSYTTDTLCHSSDDDWMASGAIGDRATSSCESAFSSDTDWMTDPSCAHLGGNIYHDTPMDPTYHDDSLSSSDVSCSNLFDDSFSSSSGYDDTFSSSISDDSWSSSSSDDSFSLSNSFDD